MKTAGRLGLERELLMNSATLVETGTIAETCIATRLRMLNRVVTNVYDEALRPLRLKVSQLNILVAAEQFGLARPAEICHSLQMDASTLSRNIDRLRARGWVETVADREDGRAHPFRVTGEGRALIQRAVPAWERAQQQAAELLGPDGVSLLHRLADDLM